MSKNTYMSDPSEPCASIARMLLQLEGAGKLDADMVEALHSHAINALDTFPRNIVTLAHSMAAAADEGWMDAAGMSNASYGIAAIADQLNGFAMLHTNLPERKEGDTSRSVKQRQFS